MYPDERCGTRSVHIHVEELWLTAAPEDEGVAGVYCAEVPAHLSDGMAAACALGAFHSTYVVNWLESFEFTVRDFRTGQELEPDEDVDWIELGKSCFDIDYA
jgi:hypothetical protein